MVGDHRFISYPSLQEWDDCRARFNHDWLRNRWAIALGKLANVLNGNVEDPETLSEIRTLLQQWNEQRAEAERLVSNSLRILAPSRYLNGRMFSDLDDDTREFFAEVADATWRENEMVEIRINSAEIALHDLNQLCNRMADSLPSENVPAYVDGLQELVEEVRVAVSRLSSSISELGKCKYF